MFLQYLLENINVGKSWTFAIIVKLVDFGYYLNNLGNYDLFGKIGKNREIEK